MQVSGRNFTTANGGDGGGRDILVMEETPKSRHLISLNYLWVIRGHDRCHVIFQEEKLICPSYEVAPPAWNSSLGERGRCIGVM